MLVVSRRRDEAVMIGDDVKVRILSIDRNQVRIGIEAPRDLAIVREELTWSLAQESISEHRQVVVETDF